MEIVNSYKLWLQSKSYSDATIRNYLVDLRKYFSFTNPRTSVETPRMASLLSKNTSLPEISTKIFNQDNLSSYFQNINQDQNYKRFLASLSKFFQFALDQKLISENLFPKALKSSGGPLCPSTDNIIETYQHQLEAKKFSISTIRNYINDINQFINWNKSYPNPPLTKEGVNNFYSPFVKGRNIRPLANERDFGSK